MESGANFDPSLLLRAATQQKQGLEQAAIDREIAAETNYANAVEAANLANYNKNLNLYQSDYAGAARPTFKTNRLEKRLLKTKKWKGLQILLVALYKVLLGLRMQGKLCRTASQKG